MGHHKIFMVAPMVLKKDLAFVKEFIRSYETTLNPPSTCHWHTRTKAYPPDAEVYEESTRWKFDEYENAVFQTDDSYRHEMGNPKPLARTIPDAEKWSHPLAQLSQRLERLAGSSSEYILRHAKVDLLVVRTRKLTIEEKGAKAFLSTAAFFVMFDWRLLL